MTYPTDFPQPLRDAIWSVALQARSQSVAPGPIERYMLEWIRVRWPRGEWRELPTDEVVQGAYIAWLNGDRTGAYSQGRLF